MKGTLYLIDGTAIIYRSYYAFINNPLINSKGFNTSAIYGTINSILRLVDQFKPKNIVISFDRKEPTFRHEITDTYKANRPPMPDELVAQLQPIQEFFKLINVQEISCAGYEADDTLATLAEKYKKDYNVIIVSGDKDFAQLVDDSVVLYDPFKGVETNADEVFNKYGLTPEQFIDYLALIGDSADNIPGVKGIGPKTAQPLLEKYHNLKGIYDNIEELKGAVKKKMETNKENAFLSQKLATIIRDVPLEFNDDFHIDFDSSKLINSVDFLQEYELKNLAKKMNKYAEKEIQVESSVEETEEENISNNQIEFKAICVNKEEMFNDLIKKLKKAEVIALDTETTSVNPHVAELVGISICFDNNDAYYLPLAHQMAENLEESNVLTELKKVVNGKKILGHNLKYDIQVLENAGFVLEGQLFDTMIASYLLDPGKMQHNMDKCAEAEFDYQMQPISNLIGTGKKQITFDLVTVEQATFYAAEDAYITYRLWQAYEDRLKSVNLYPLFEEIEIPLMDVLRKIEKNGVYINTETLKEISKKIQKRISELTYEIYEISGKHFNINSTQQLGKVLFDDLEIPPVKKTKTGYSTDNSVLEKLAPNHHIAKLLIEYRQLSKLESTYVNALPKLVLTKTNRIHSSFNQTVASTGRLSSSNPNLQNIPIRRALGKEVRKAFVAEKNNWVILAADYSQIELRLLAILSQDPNLVKAFNDKEDIHTQTACLIFDTTKDEVTSDQRSYAKVINFGIIYGMGAQRLSRELNIPVKEAKEFINNYFAKFPTIQNYLKDTVLHAKQNEYVSTILNRRLYLPHINSSNKRLVSEAERIANNMPIQGSAADIIKKAMINLHKKIEDRDDIKMIIQVHDELVFEVKKESLEELKILINNEMESALPKEYSDIVPLVVDIGVGDNWFEAH